MGGGWLCARSCTMREADVSKVSPATETYALPNVRASAIATNRLIVPS